MESDAQLKPLQSSKVQLDAQWLDQLSNEFDQPYMKSLREFLVQEKRAGNTVFPKGDEIFAALNHTPFNQVKVVILGQDPYHGPGQAHGLCFSVKPGTKIPPSLVNIYKEIESDLGLSGSPFHDGDLTGWADQGVLLLNSVLTVRAHQAASHQGKGWETFTDQVIRCLSEQRQSLVFMLWGSYAQNKGGVIDTSKHLVLKSAHPSPLSAYRGFIGNKHFSQCNEYLAETGQAVIDWTLSLNATGATQ